MATTPFVQLAQLGEELEGTSKRLQLTQLLAAFLRALSAQELPAAVRLTIGQIFPEWDGRALNLSVSAAMRVLDGLVDASPQLHAEVGAQAVDPGETTRMLLERARRSPPVPPPLSILDVYDAFSQIAEVSGPGSRAEKDRLLRSLLERATAVEAKYIVRIIFQEMRHGVNEGVMLSGIAKASGVPVALVRRANQLWGDLGDVAQVALTEGRQALQKASLRLFRPIKPMLAQTAADHGEAFERYGGRLALEYKLDGARVQIHRQGDRVRIYTRNLSDVTDSLPDLAARVRDTLLAEEAIVEGEAIAVDVEGKPLPFQELMRRFRRKHDVAAMADQVPVQLCLFDALMLDGVSLIDASNEERWAALERATGGQHLVTRLVPGTIEEAKAFAERAKKDGHEGVMAKDLSSTYTPGVRGKSWLKLKHVVSLDMVVVAADWGYGRRHGWLSNYHLGLRDPATTTYHVVGKTYKGLTDDQFREMTQRLLALQTSRAKGTVHVRPEVVVEVLFNEIQESSQYEAGYALRFARIARVRDDKRPAEADTLETLRKLYEDQFRYKGRLD